MKKLFITLLFFIFASSANAMNIQEFTDYSDGSETIDGTSAAVVIAGAKGYEANKAFTIQITDSSSAVGVLQGLIYVDAGDSGDSSALWQDLTDGTISGNGMFSVYAPVTHIRVKLTSGTCKARILIK